MQVTTGRGGWFQISDLDGIPGRVYVRASDVEGRVRVTEIYLDGRGEPMQAGGLRGLPLAAIEAVIAETIDELGDVLLAGRTAGPDLSRLAATAHTTYGRQTYAGRHCESCGGPLRGDERHGNRSLTDWLALSYFAQHEGSGIPRPPMPRDRPRASGEPAEPISLSEPLNGLTDQFLLDVARAYRVAVEQRKPPATTLAAAVGVERRTVESWIYKARKRGLMAAAPKRGRVV